jgi:hypothetical protein
MKRRFLVSAIFVLFAGAAFAQSSSALTDPREIVEEIYQISAGKEGEYKGPSAFDDKRVRKLYFSKSLLAAVTKMEKKSAKLNEPILDFDPITDSQDPSVKGLLVQVEEEMPGKVTVEAQFKSFDDAKARSVHYDFIKQGRVWKLDEIRGGRDNKWSLRDIIK